VETACSCGGQIRQLGAVYPEQALAVFQDDPAQHALLAPVSERTEEVGGEVRLLETTSPSVTREQRFVGRFQKAREAECAEVRGTSVASKTRSRREERKDRLTFTETEDL